MLSFKPASEYVAAIHTAARHRFACYPSAVYSVLVARFRYGLGPKLHSLFSLVHTPSESWGDYLTDEGLRKVLRMINKPAAREVVNDKLIFHDHCITHSLPTIPVICAIEKLNINHPKSSLVLATEDEWRDCLIDAPERIFVKPIDGTWGRGAFIAQRIEDHWHYCGEYGSATMLYAFLRLRMSGQQGWMVQPVIEAHQSLRSITSSAALPTIRANTCLVDGIPRLLFAVLRIPVGNSVTDNFAHGTTGNIIAPIHLDTGRLGKCRGATTKRWPEIYEVAVHPDTGNAIEGFQIPMWSEVLELLVLGQKSLPNLETLGWDIAVTDNGPIIVETNATYDIDIVQVAYQRGVRADIEEIFGAVP